MGLLAKVAVGSGLVKYGARNGTLEMARLHAGYPKYVGKKIIVVRIMTELQSETLVAGGPPTKSAIFKGWDHHFFQGQPTTFFPQLQRFPP
jgi:hypothetical protein